MVFLKFYGGIFALVYLMIYDIFDSHWLCYIFKILLLALIIFLAC